MDDSKLVDLVVTALIVCKKGRANRSDLDELLASVRNFSDAYAPGLFERLQGRVRRKAPRVTCCRRSS